MSEGIACAECGDALTDEERHYYGHRCGQCEMEVIRHIGLMAKGGARLSLRRFGLMAAQATGRQ